MSQMRDRLIRRLQDASVCDCILAELVVDTILPSMIEPTENMRLAAGKASREGSPYFAQMWRAAIEEAMIIHLTREQLIKALQGAYRDIVDMRAASLTGENKDRPRERT